MVLCVWYMCTRCVWACTHVEDRGWFQAASSVALHLKFWDRSLTEPGLAAVPGICLCLPLCWDHRALPLSQLFSWGLGTQTQFLMLEQKVLYYWAISPAHHFWGFVTSRASYTTRWLQIHYVAKDNLKLLDSPAATSSLLELCVPNMTNHSKDYEKE